MTTTETKSTPIVITIDGEHLYVATGRYPGVCLAPGYLADASIPDHEGGYHLSPMEARRLGNALLNAANDAEQGA